MTTPAERLAQTLETVLEDLSAEPTPPAPVSTPAGLNPATVYQMRIRTLTVRRPVQMRAEGDDFPGLDSEPLYVTEWIERRMTCRNCRSGTDLSLRGKWGDLATVVCMACDHTWPAPLPPAASVHALQAAIAQSAEKSGGLPTEPA